MRSSRTHPEARLRKTSMQCMRAALLPARSSETNPHQSMSSSTDLMSLQTMPSIESSRISTTKNSSSEIEAAPETTTIPISTTSTIPIVTLTKNSNASMISKPKRSGKILNEVPLSKSHTTAPQHHDASGISYRRLFRLVQRNPR